MPTEGISACCAHSLAGDARTLAGCKVYFLILRKPQLDEPVPPFPGDVLKKLPKELQELLQQKMEVYIIIRLAMDEGRFIMMDTGRRLALDEDRESRELVTENYNLIKKLAKTVEYQYVLDMNYSVLTF